MTKEKQQGIEEGTEVAGKPFTIAIEIRPNNDDCDCVLCAARRDMFNAFMNRAQHKGRMTGRTNG
jgi:hypothetical protein